MMNKQLPKMVGLAGTHSGLQEALQLLNQKNPTCIRQQRLVAHSPEDILKHTELCSVTVLKLKTFLQNSELHTNLTILL